MDSLQFNGRDPGAVTLGNFINYYNFHPPEERLNLLPTHLWVSNKNGHFRCLDIGCNTGELTTRVYETILNSLHPADRHSVQPTDLCHMLGIDIDPVLIERAQELNKHPEHVVFKCLDFMSEEKDGVLRSYLQNCDAHFDVIFCFSVTMWIHLNHGDDGLDKFLKEISEIGSMLVIEPQPWKCYKSAVRRLKKCNTTFPLFKEITIRESVEQHIEDFLSTACQFIKVFESPATKWGRKLVCFKKRQLLD